MSVRRPLRRLPGVPRVLLHADAGRRARHVRTLTGSSDWRRRAVDAAAFARIAIAGTSSLPDADGDPWPGIDRVGDALRSQFPALVVLGAVLPRQTDRRRLSLLCHAAGNPLVVKLGPDETAFRAEHRALELLARDPLPGIATARPCGVGLLDVDTVDGSPVAYVATSALGLRAQRPAVDEPLRTFASDLAARLAALSPPPSGTGGLVPVHGDLTPWNLRRTGRGLALFDWESVGWGPPGSDLAHYRRTSDEIRPWWRRHGVSRR